MAPIDRQCNRPMRLACVRLLSVLAMGILLAFCITPDATLKASVQPPRNEHARVSEPLVIVVNRANPVRNLSMRELRAIFLGERSYWPSGKRITLVLRDSGNPERQSILHQVCGMSESEYKTHLLRGLFAGDILVTPKTLSSPSGVRRFIFNVPGAIGSLRLSEVDDSVSIVSIDNLLPSDQGYSLHLIASSEDAHE